jgi:hypothetical protein
MTERMPVKHASLKTFLLAVICCCLLLLTGCQKEFVGRPTAIPTNTPTLTLVPTLTLTPTLVPTITPTPTRTPTQTLTPYPTLTATPTATQVTPRPAILPYLVDTDGKVVDWSYAYVTSLGYAETGEVNQLSALLAFRLLDRAIYRRNLNFMSQDVTIFYLNVVHDFNGTQVPMGLVIGGAFGSDVPLNLVPAGGSSYVQTLQLTSAEPLDPFLIHRDANQAYAKRSLVLTDLLMTDLEALLPTLPDELIILADHPILLPKNDWQQAKLDMTRVSALMARYYPLFELDAYDRIVDQSDFAFALRDYLLRGIDMPSGIYFYASQILVLVTP